jgi:hypothetical protein
MPRQKRHLLQLLQKQTPNQPASEVEDDDSYDVVDLDLHRSYGRLKVVKSNLWDDDAELPDHILDRLAQIRELALQKYREVML